ncbi:MAG: hypothetical protein Q9M97_07705, partial [Candidatus Gracilibacteria bacterium]|nr:hypothetical protein [Candidatus Gracilibacteria bacterium]
LKCYPFSTFIITETAFAFSTAPHSHFKYNYTIFLFWMVFNFNTSFFNFSNAGDSKLYSLISILVNEDIYDEVSGSVEIYAEDISKQLENTKVVIIPTPVNSKTF